MKTWRVAGDGDAARVPLARRAAPTRAAAAAAGAGAAAAARHCCCRPWPPRPAPEAAQGLRRCCLRRAAQPPPPPLLAPPRLHGHHGVSTVTHEQIRFALSCSFSNRAQNMDNRGTFAVGSGHAGRQARIAAVPAHGPCCARRRLLMHMPACAGVKRIKTAPCEEHLLQHSKVIMTESAAHRVCRDVQAYALMGTCGCQGDNTTHDLGFQPAIGPGELVYGERWYEDMECGDVLPDISAASCACACNAKSGNLPHTHLICRLAMRCPTCSTASCA